MHTFQVLAYMNIVHSLISYRFQSYSHKFEDGLCYLLKPDVAHLKSDIV